MINLEKIIPLIEKIERSTQLLKDELRKGNYSPKNKRSIENSLKFRRLKNILEESLTVGFDVFTLKDLKKIIKDEYCMEVSELYLSKVLKVVFPKQRVKDQNKVFYLLELI